MGWHYFDQNPVCFYVFLTAGIFLDLVLIFKLVQFFICIKEMNDDIHNRAPIAGSGDQPGRPMKPADYEFLRWSDDLPGNKKNQNSV